MCASDHAHSDHKLAIMHAVSLVDELFFCCDDKNVFYLQTFRFRAILSGEKKNQSSKLSVSVSILVD